METLLVFKSAVSSSRTTPVLTFTRIGVGLPPEQMEIQIVIAAIVMMPIVPDVQTIVLSTVYQAVGDGYTTSGV